MNGAGEVYIAGITNSVDFPTTPGSLQPALREDLDFFIAKLSASGDSLLFSTYIGGTSNEDYVGGVQANSSGEILFAGATQSSDFPVTAGAFDTVAGSASGSTDIVALKLNAAGNALVYSTYLGSNVNERIYGFAVASNGGIVVSGGTVSHVTTPFPSTAGALNNLGDQFITRIAPDGASLTWSALIGTEFGAGLRIRAMALDASDNVYLTGLVSITDMPVVGGFDSTRGGDFDGFVAKINSSGTAYVYSTYLGGSLTDEPLAIAVDSSGAAYVAGVTGAISTNDFPTTPGTLRPTPTANWNGFLTKIAPAGNAIAWSTYFLPPNYSSSNPIALDSANRIYLATISNPPLELRVNEPPETCLAYVTSPAVVRVLSDGSAVDFGTRVGAPLVMSGGSNVSSFPMNDLAVDSAHNVYVAGSVNSPLFPTYRAFQTTKAGGSDITPDLYVAKLSEGTPNAMPTLAFSAASYSVNETAGTATITVNRTGRSAGSVRVRATTAAGGTATLGSDFTAVDTTLEWLNGDTAPKTFAVPILTDAAAEGAETVNLTLSKNWCLGDLGAQSTAVLTINDAAPPPPPPPPMPGSLQLSTASYSVAEGGGNASITVTRTGGSDGAVSARLATSNGTATAGSDYTATDVIVNFAAGDAANKTVSVPITQDTGDEPDETVTLTLSSATGGATLGAQTTATLTIADDDLPPAPPPPPPAPPGGGGGGGGGIDGLLLATLLGMLALRASRRPARGRVPHS